MKLTFIGATHEVTGSCYFLEAAGKKFLVDCGMEQGPDQYENQEIPVALSDVDFALLTHAHIDHSGNFPLAYAKGFRGPIYATNATCDLCDIMLRDSAHIQMQEADWKNRKAKRNARQEPYEPPYTMEDAQNAIQHRLCLAPMERRCLSAMGSRYGLRMWDTFLAQPVSRYGSLKRGSRKRSSFPGISEIKTSH